MRKWENGKSGKWENMEMGKWGNGKIEKIWKHGKNGENGENVKMASSFHLAEMVTPQLDPFEISISNDTHAQSYHLSQMKLVP